MNEELKALKEWKSNGRDKTMSECIDWKNSHSQMFIEGYRVAKEKYCNEWHNIKIELPNEFGEYLVSYDKNCKQSFSVLYYDRKRCWYEEGSELSVSKPYWWKEIK